MNDLINGLFEFGAAAFLGMNLYRIYRDKKVVGVSIWPAAFFTLWGIWNLYYYPSLDQFCSFSGGLAVVIVNSIWTGMAIYYTWRNNAPITF